MRSPRIWIPLFLVVGAGLALLLAEVDPCWLQGHRFGSFCETPANMLGALIR